MGLFLGASLITVFEFMMYVAYNLYSLTSGQRLVNITKDVSATGNTAASRTEKEDKAPATKGNSAISAYAHTIYI